MWLLIVEAFIALGMFVFIVWWTMSSRRRIESAATPPAEPTDQADSAALAAQAKATDPALATRTTDDAPGSKPG